MLKLSFTNHTDFLDNALYQPIWRKSVCYHLKYHCISNFEKYQYIDFVSGEQKVATLNKHKYYLKFYLKHRLRMRLN